ncbi:MFS transporter [Saccharopolyspora sp. SCSIO 74807]|uniref:MFS transporter n=1 Tax=Saccharopolyspora sp. SCSIO 74807 TaxID=3118084 RepID=UPI0030D14EE8
MLFERSAASRRRNAPGDRLARRSDLRTGLYVLVVLTAGAYLPSPLYPAYQAMFGISDLAMTVIYAMFALVSAPALVLFGSASDALGRRAVLRASVVLAAVASICFAVASGPMWFVLGRAVQGIALGTATGAASALISERAGDWYRVSGAMLASAAFLAGTAIGPIAGGLLARYAPAPQVSPYAVHAVLLLIGWRRVAKLTGAEPVARRWRFTGPRIPHGMRRLFAASAVTGFLAWTVAGLFLAVIPTLLDRAGAADPAVTGGIFGTMLIFSVLVQPLAGRLGPARAQLGGLGGLLVSLSVLALAPGGATQITLAAAVVAGLGHGLAYGGAAAAVDAAAPAGQRGAVTGALYLAFYLGAGFPAVAVGLITLGHPLSAATTWVAGAAACLVPFAGAAVMLTSDAVDRAPAGERRSRQRVDGNDVCARRKNGTTPLGFFRRVREPRRSVPIPQRWETAGSGPAHRSGTVRGRRAGRRSPTLRRTGRSRLDTAVPARPVDARSRRRRDQ